MELLFVFLKKHGAVDILSYICWKVILNSVTNHVRICTCVIVQFTQKYNLIISFVYNHSIYKLVIMVNDGCSVY